MPHTPDTVDGGLTVIGGGALSPRDQLSRRIASLIREQFGTRVGRTACSRVSGRIADVVTEVLSAAPVTIETPALSALDVLLLRSELLERWENADQGSPEALAYETAIRMLRARTGATS